jgi:hypothetical protein
MSESRKKIVGATAIAVTLVAFLGFLSYQFFPGPNVSTTFALVWLEGKQEPANSALTLLISTLSRKFTFQNETTRWAVQAMLKTYGIPDDPYIMLRGEDNATWLKSIGFHPYNIICTPADLPFSGAYNITMTMNTTIQASLETITNIDLGAYNCWNESYIIYQNNVHSESSRIGESTWNNSGYWEPKDANWKIEVEELSSMVQGSGTALITFRGVLHVDLNFEITLDGVGKKGSETLSWEGNMGTIRVTYDQSRIVWIKYEIPAIRLTMLTVPE